MSHRFDFYGLDVVVEGGDGAAQEEVRRDFAYFHVPEAMGERPGSTSPAGSVFRILMHLEAPPYDALPSLPAAFLTPRNVCYRDGRTSYIDYFGRGLGVLDREARTCDVYSEDRQLLREIVYLLILSTAGRHLDRRRLHRIHALGVNYQGRGVLLLLPSGGGKSTMAMKLLARSDVRLLAEDTPLVDRNGRLHPFPLCIGMKSGIPPDVPERYIRTVRRMEFDPKRLIDLEYFADRLSGPVEPGAVIVGERNLGTDSSITPLSRPRAVRALMKYLVVGLGVYQGLEFMLERGTGELLGKGGLAASRLHNGLRLLSKAPAYRFVLGRDTERNADTCLRFLQERWPSALGDGEAGPERALPG